MRASGRSTLFTTRITGRWASSALRRTKRVWGRGPSDASTRSSTPSTIVSPRSTSPPKSACPGVSMMLSLVSPYRTAVFLARIVIPFSRSRSIESMTRSATSCPDRKAPDCQSIASTSVVLPWSTWAMIATLRRSERRGMGRGMVGRSGPRQVGLKLALAPLATQRERSSVVGATDRDSEGGSLLMRLPVRVLIAIAGLALLSAPAASADSFSLGVASGEVAPDSAVLWGRADQPGETQLEVATDTGFTHVVQSLPVQASPANDLTIQSRVDELRSSTRYWYRFTSGAAASDVGTFVTAPKAGDDATINFAWTGDYDAERAIGETEPFWNDFGVFGSMEAERNDFNIALGDTIYSDSEVPGRLNPVALTVEQKWAKYRLNLGQAPLADLRGAAGFYSHWDDHEFINDFSRFESVFSSGTIDGQELYQRGVKAFTDYAPVDFSGHDGLYRTRRWGKNLELFFLDERSFRSAKATKGGVCDNPQTGQPDLAPTAPQGVRNAFAALIPSLAEPVSQACLDAINDPSRTLLGGPQLKTFLHDVRHSQARFKVVMNELPIQQYYSLPYDRWEGYEADRQHVLSAL